MNPSQSPAENPNNMKAARNLSLSTTAKSSSHAVPPLKVAVIGAGAAGLVTARILLRHGIQPILLEKDSAMGGVWNYRPNSSTRPMYRGLRTNLPREIMAYREFPWGGDGTTRSFVTHGQVKDYLKRYAKKFGLEDWIRFGCNVRHLKVLKEKASRVNPQWPKIRLEWEDVGAGATGGEQCRREGEDFDAVCVCNGHYAKPFLPEIPGLQQYFQGKIYHSIEYDDPSIFKDQVVLCVGGRASGSDLAREISMYAKKVYLSDTTCPDLSEQQGEPIQEGNVAWVPTTVAVNADSSISFRRDCRDTPKVDCIFFCSGYDYHFPFINETSNVDLFALPGERRVMPLYEQLWHAAYPSLTFIGLQHSIVPFPFFELQAEAIASQFQKEINIEKPNHVWTLPSLNDRIQAAEADAQGGGPKELKRVQDTHFLGSFQWDACLKCAKFAGICDENLEKYIRTNKAIYDHASKERKSLFPGGIDSYRSNSYVRDDEHESFQVYFIQEEIAVDA